MEWTQILHALPIALLLTIPTLLISRALRTNSVAMSPMDHFTELRLRFLRVGGCLTGYSVLFLMFGITTWNDWVILVPTVSEGLAAAGFDYLSNRLVPADVTVIVTRPIDGFVAQWSVSLLASTIVCMPLVLAELVGFVRPALQPKELKLLRQAMLPVFVLFLVGVTFAFLVVVPLILQTLYGYATALGAVSFLAASELVSFTLGLLAVFGLAFQLPVIMVVVTKANLVSPKFWLSKWRHAIVASLIFAAIVTDPSVTSQIIVAVPLILLYGVGLAAIKITKS